MGVGAGGQGEACIGKKEHKGRRSKTGIGSRGGGGACNRSWSRMGKGIGVAGGGSNMRRRRRGNRSL